MLTRIRYIKHDNKLRIKNDIIVSDKFYNATIDPVTLTYEIETPDGPIVGKSTSLHHLKRAVKRKLQGIGARFKIERRTKRQTNGQ